MENLPIKYWTVEEIKTVYTLWESKTTAQIAADLGRTVTAVSNMAFNIRKAGYKMARKKKYGSLQNLIHEALKA